MEPERVQDDGQRAHRHGGAGPDRRDQNAGDREQQAGGDRHAQRVVDEREEQILADVSHRRPRQPPGPDDAPQIAFHEGDASALHRDIGARAHRDADGRLRQGGRVVDPIARHRDQTSRPLQRLDDRPLVAGQHLGTHIVNPELPRDRVRGQAVVAGQHHRRQPPDRGRGRAAARD